MSLPWYVLIIGPQQEITTVWRIHLLGLEMFTPVIRRRVKTGRVHKGRHITRLVARPMFPSYGFIRQSGALDTEAILRVYGVRDFLRNERGAAVTLPHEAVLAIRGKQDEIQDEFLAGRRSNPFKPGDKVKVDDGGIYTGLVAPVDRVRGHDRVEILFGMIRHSLPADMVVAA
jgi:transcription antitermination factor NusG